MKLHSSCTFSFCGRCNIWWSSTVTFHCRCAIWWSCTQVAHSVFVAGAVFGEIWKDSRSAKCCIFRDKMLAASAQSNLGCAAGCRVTGSCSDHSPIMLGSAPQWKRRFTRFWKICLLSWSVISGTIFGDVGGWLPLPRALYWTFHVWRGSIMWVSFHGRRNVGDFEGCVLMLRALHWTFHVRRGSIILETFVVAGAILGEIGGQPYCSAQCRWRSDLPFGVSFFVAGWRVAPLAPRVCSDCQTWASSFHCVSHPIGCPRNDVSCVATIKHECRSAIVLCIPEAALRNLLDASFVATIKRACTLVALYSILYIFCCTLFVVWNSTGVLLCSTE